ncbi:LIC_13387 family protein [Leptospira perolatii]|nr:hypothetical protein [Leptospira perolatii]
MEALLISKVLFLIGCVPYIFLGTAHIVLTFKDMKKSSALSPANLKVRTSMEESNLKLTNETTIWKAWIGFNFSHGMGAVFFGFIYLWIGISDFGFLLANWLLLPLAIVISLSYLILSLRFWFSKPTIGISIASVMFVASYVTSWLIQ